MGQLIKIKEYKFEKKETGSKDFILPIEPVYYSVETGIKKSIKITPIYTTWQKEKFQKEEEIWKFNIIIVYTNFDYKIEKEEVRVSDLEDLYYSKILDDFSTLIKQWVDGELLKITREEFRLRFELTLQKIVSDD